MKQGIHRWTRGGYHLISWSVECVGPAWINQEFTMVESHATLAGSSLGGRASPGTQRPAPCGVAVQRSLEVFETAKLADTINACGQE